MNEIENYGVIDRAITKAERYYLSDDYANRFVGSVMMIMSVLELNPVDRILLEEKLGQLLLTMKNKHDIIKP